MHKNHYINDNLHSDSDHDETKSDNDNDKYDE